MDAATLRASWRPAAVAGLLVACLAAAALLVALVAAPDRPGSVAACKEAMRAQYRAALATGAVGTRPKACAHIDPNTLGRLAGEVIAEQEAN